MHRSAHVLRAWWPLILSAVFATAVHVWAIAGGYPPYINSDNAVPGLMGLHVLRGEFSLYEWGRLYFGAVYPILSAPFLWAFPDSPVIASRMAGVPLVLIFHILWVFFVHKTWGKPTAIITSWLLAVPGFYMMIFVYFHQFLVWAPIMSAITLIAFTWYPSSERGALRKFWLLGFLCGFGVWTETSLLLFALAVFAVLIRASDEWRILHTAINDRIGKVASAIVWFIMQAACVTLAFISVVYKVWDEYKVQASSGLRLLLGLIAIGLFFSSKRKRKILECATSVFCGVAVGSIPIWLPYLLYGILPYQFRFYHAPFDWDFIRNIVWQLWGGIPMSFLYEHHSGKTEITLNILLIGINAVCLLFALILNRRAMWTLVTGNDIRREERGFLYLLAVGCGILGASMYHGTMIPGNVRHAIGAWPVLMVFTAIALTRINSRNRVIGSALAVFLVLQTSISNITWYERSFQRDGTFAEDTVYALEHWVTKNDVRYGYTDYWRSYGLSLATRERLQMATFKTGSRYPAYTKDTESSKRYALILWPPQSFAADMPTTTIAFRNALQNGGMLIDRDIILSAKNKVFRSNVIDRRIFGFFDVWILEDPAITE